MNTHSHKGVERTNGSLRPHPISRKHKNPKVQKYHNLSVNSKPEQTYEVTEKGKSFINRLKDKITSVKSIVLPVDKDGYVLVDFDNFEYKGLRLKKEQRSGRTKRTVGMQIPKEIKLF